MDWSRSGGRWGSNTRVICYPAPGRPDSAKHEATGSQQNCAYTTTIQSHSYLSSLVYNHVRRSGMQQSLSHRIPITVDNNYYNGHQICDVACIVCYAEASLDFAIHWETRSTTSKLTGGSINDACSVFTLFICDIYPHTCCLTVIEHVFDCGKMTPWNQVNNDSGNVFLLHSTDTLFELILTYHQQASVSFMKIQMCWICSWSNHCSAYRNCTLKTKLILQGTTSKSW